jgi:hypothetical protein
MPPPRILIVAIQLRHQSKEFGTHVGLKAHWFPPAEIAESRDGIIGVMTDVMQILSQIESGDPSAAERLLPLVYEELRKLAAAVCECFCIDRSDAVADVVLSLHV